MDLLYVHNPAELQLAPLGKERFFARLSAAFQALEKLRCDGVCMLAVSCLACRTRASRLMPT